MAHWRGRCILQRLKTMASHSLSEQQLAHGTEPIDAGATSFLELARQAALDGAPLACPNPSLVRLGRLPFGGHTFRLEVTNAAGSDSWETSWTGGNLTTAGT